MRATVNRTTKVSMDAVAELPKPKAKVFNFTKENARTMGERGAEIRRANKLKRQEQIAKCAEIAELQPDEKYRLERIARTREQIRSLDIKLANSDDPREIKALCESIAKLADLERMLAMRPNPGSYRPSKPRSESQSSDATPL